MGAPLDRYLNRTDPAAARDLQRSARLDNNYILKVPHESRATRLTALASQAGASSAFLASTFSTARMLEVATESLLLDLTPTTARNSYKRFEAALERLGRMLGFASTRPDQEDGVGPDNFWAVGGDRYWVIECKSEATSSTVSRANLEQLSHSTDWFDDSYPEPRYTAAPVLIHPSRQPAWDAVPRQGARAMTFERLTALREAVAGFVGCDLPRRRLPRRGRGRTKPGPVRTELRRA